MEIVDGTIYRDVVRRRGSSSYLLLPAKVAAFLELAGGTNVEVKVQKHDGTPPTLVLVRIEQ